MSSKYLITKEKGIVIQMMFNFLCCLNWNSWVIEVQAVCFCGKHIQVGYLLGTWQALLWDVLGDGICGWVYRRSTLRTVPLVPRRTDGSVYTSISGLTLLTYLTYFIGQREQSSWVTLTHLWVCQYFDLNLLGHFFLRTNLWMYILIALPFWP